MTLAGCGYVGDPLPPLANIPQQVLDLRVVQRGGNLIAQFTVPLRSTENIVLRPGVQLDLRAGAAAPPWNADTWAAAARRISPGPVSGSIARYTFPAAEWVGKDVTVAVRTTGPTGRSSGWSNIENVAVVAAPPQPAKPHAESTAAGVRLEWQGPAGDYRIFRRAADEADFARAGAAGALSWTDTTAEYGKAYVYVVQRVEKVGGGREAESELSDAVPITPRDTFAPAAPANVRAAVGAASVELAWDPNAEADLASYQVYRAVAGGEFERVAEGLQLPAWSDRKVESGKVYRYAVTAVDQVANEGARSAVVEATIP